MKRLFDIVFSLLALIILFPFCAVVALVIILDSRGGVFYLQKRVGQNNKDFDLFKFRTMRTGSDRKGLLTVGSRDPRVTAVGYYLRKYKVDELPQLLNVLLGSMSFVGPRPEVRKYVDLYTEEQRKILQVKPGITDYASLAYFDENDLLVQSQDPERTYISQVMPAKLELNKKYIAEAGLITDIKIIWQTLRKIFS
jgi:lipopolysaccharide/colanic/teichoic acid biosynthesis glycosyltransferase